MMRSSLYQNPFYKLCLNDEFKSEIQWWLHFDRRFNGYVRILSIDTPLIAIYTDASSAGFGALFGFDWMVGSFRE